METGNTIEVKREYLDAALLLAAKDDARYYLNAVWIGKGPRGGAVMVATDGHCAAIINLRQPYPDVYPAGGFILARDRVAAGLKLAGRKDVVDLAPDQIGPITGAGIDAQYPDIFRVVPDAVTGEVSQFNPVYLATFEKARRLVCGAGLMALRCEDPGPLEGAYLYYRPAAEVSPDAVGRLAICTLHGGEAVVGTLRQGSKRATYTVLGFAGQAVVEDAWLESAVPVVWIKTA